MFKMPLHFRSLVFFIFILSLLFPAGCEKKVTSVPQGRLKISLVDSPALLPTGTEKINLTISSVEVHSSKVDWDTVVTTPHTYNLLELVNGVTAILADTSLQTGSYTQMRLKISDASIVINGVTYDLVVPSGEETGIKLLNFEIKANTITELIIDFDAEKSVKQSGTQYILHPTYKVFEKTASGSISGQVYDADIGPQEGIGGALVLAITDSDTSSTFSDSTGYYKLILLPGIYNLSAWATGYQPDTTSYRGKGVNAGSEQIIKFPLVKASF